MKPYKILHREDKTIKTARKISEKYNELSGCCNIISQVEKKTDEMSIMLQMNSGGWKIRRHEVVNAGIDIEKVYLYIKKLAMEKKEELKIELKDLDL